MSAIRPASDTSKIQTRTARTALTQGGGLLLVATLALVVAVVTFDPRLDLGGDSANYIVLGKALRAGLGMRYIHLPEAPKADKFPIGFPLLLAGVEWVAPDSLTARKILVAACYVGAVPLVFRLASCYVPPFLALVVSVLVALNPFVLGLARSVLSEVPYLFVSLIALSLLERALAGPQPTPWGAWVGGVAALLAATQVRTIGWSLLLALVVVLLLRRRYRTLTLVLAAVGLLIAIALLTGIRPIGSRYLAIWEQRVLAPEAAGPGGAAALSRIATSAIRYGSLVIPAALLPIPMRVELTPFKTLPTFVPLGSGGALAFVIQMLLGGLSLLALTLGAWPSLRRGRLTPTYTAAFMGVLVLWPPEFLGARMVVPVIPFLFLFSAIGLHRLWTWARPRVPALGRGVPVLVGALILTQLYGSASLGVLTRDDSPEWEELVEMAEWIRTHTDPHDLILTDFAPHLFILSGRKTDFLYRRRGKGEQGVATLPEVLQYIDETGAKYLCLAGSIKGQKGLDVKRELFAYAEQPGSGWTVAYRGLRTAIYAKDDPRAEALKRATRSRSD